MPNPDQTFQVILRMHDLTKGYRQLDQNLSFLSDSSDLIQTYLFLPGLFGSDPFSCAVLTRLQHHKAYHVVFVPLTRQMHVFVQAWRTD